MLVNLVLEQINDRDTTFAYPNEEIADIIEQGRKIWFEEVDTNADLIVPRFRLDDVLVKYQVVKDYKEVNRFLAGVLSGDIIKRHEQVKYS